MRHINTTVLTTSFLAILLLLGSLIGWSYGSHYVIHPQFDAARSFHEGLAAVEIGGKWGYINRYGTYVINPQFDRAGSFTDDMAPVWTGNLFGGKWGYISK